MTTSKRIAWALGLTALLSAGAGFAEAAPRAEDEPCASLCTRGAPAPSLGRALMRGEALVLAFRHAEKCQGRCSDLEERSDCLKPEAGLTEPGRRQAKTLAEGVRRLGLTFEVLESSPYCRTVQTAEILGGVAPLPETSRTEALLSGAGLGVANLPADAGEGNRAYVTHSNSLGDLAEPCLAEIGLQPRLDDAEHQGLALIYGPPPGGGERRFLGCLWPEDWALLAEIQEADSPEVANER